MYYGEKVPNDIICGVLYLYGGIIMIRVRIIEIPKMKAAYSGPLHTSEEFEAFNDWFSKYHATLKYELYPRDFMWYNERLNVREWFYALPSHAEISDCGGFEICDLPSGLFANIASSALNRKHSTRSIFL